MNSRHSIERAKERAGLNNCFLRKGEFCTQLRNIPCGDFKPLPVTPVKDYEPWHQYSASCDTRWYAGRRGEGGFTNG